MNKINPDCQVSFFVDDYCVLSYLPVFDFRNNEKYKTGSFKAHAVQEKFATVSSLHIFEKPLSLYIFYTNQGSTKCCVFENIQLDLVVLESKEPNREGKVFFKYESYLPVN